MRPAARLDPGNGYGGRYFHTGSGVINQGSRCIHSVRKTVLRADWPPVRLVG